MKKILLSTAFFATSIATAATPIDGWYSSVFGGYAYLPNNIHNSYAGLSRTDAQYNAGYNAGGSFGFKSTPLRYEGQLTYLSANLDRFKVDGVSQTGPNGFNHTFLAMANVYYDFPAIVSPIEPYLGVGLGYGYVDGLFKSTGPLNTTRFSASDNVVAYQAMGGLTYNFIDYCSLFVEYRYVGTGRVDNFGRPFQAHLANAGAVYRFDGNTYK